MQGGRDLFSGFGGFGRPRSLMSSFLGGRDPFDDFFGGRDPFDDPFFRQPFGGSFQSSFFGPTRHPFGNLHPSGFLEQQPAEPLRSRRGPIIEELNSDDEKEEEGKSDSNNNPRKHGRSSHGPFVELPDDEAEERSSKLMHFQRDLKRPREMASQPQGHAYTFQSSTVSYGGPNGTYYKSSKKRTGSDGLTFEEAKEANSATGQASHGVFRGIHDKGHSVLRKLNSDGRVDTRQTLHNLNEDDLTGFEEAWKGSARKHMPGVTERQGVIGPGCCSQETPSRSGCRSLPSTERLHHHPGNVRPHIGDGSSCPRNSGNPHLNVRDSGCPSRVRSSKSCGESCGLHPRRR